MAAGEHLIPHSIKSEGSETPQAETAQILVEFLEVAITSIIFLKGIYPSGAFERWRYMNLVVQKARHPQLYDYIHSAVYGLRTSIQQGLVEGIAVVFFEKSNDLIERFMFKLKVNQSCDSKVEEADLEFSIRSFLIKLPVSRPPMKVLPQDCRWEIAAYFRSDPRDSRSMRREMWVMKEIKQWLEPPSITPIKSMSGPSLVIQLYLEHPSLSKASPREEILARSLSSAE